MSVQQSEQGAKEEIHSVSTEELDLLENKQKPSALAHDGR